MSGGRADRSADDLHPHAGTSIDELLDRAVTAINRGDRATASELAGQVLAVDRSNADAEDLLGDDLLGTVGADGEIRRLTILFVDLVDSTLLSGRVEPETYRLVVGRYREQVAQIVDQYGGHIGSTKGDGLLAVFGHPTAHEDDPHRAVAAALEMTRAVARLSTQTTTRFGIELHVRVGVHRGLVYLDIGQDDVYGFAANLASRIATLAEPDTIAVSNAVAALVDNAFELVSRPAAPVKGVDGLVSFSRVLGERPQATPMSSMPLVGRDRERDRLQRAWQQARDGKLAQCGIAFRGEPGIGKSRLAHAAAELVEKAGGNVVELRGSPLHSDTGLHPLRRLLEHRCGITRLTGGRERLQLLEAELHCYATDLSTALPLLAPVIGVGPEHGYEPAAVEGRSLYEMIADAAHRYLLACLQNNPGLVIAEDVHWFDPSTMELLNSIFSGADGRLMVVLTGRDGTWLRSEWPVTLFELTPLTDGESDALIKALDPTVTRTQRAAVRERCDGVPFYIEHVVAGLAGHSGEGHVPEALYEPLFARLHARSDVVPVVEAGAVIGRSGDIALLRSVVGANVDIDAVISELAKIRVLERIGTDGWRFRHELLREVAAELPPPSRRRDLHARVAHALVDAASGVQPDWRVVATHYEHAQQFALAVQAYQRASAEARRRGALDEAMARLTDALGQLRNCASGSARDRLEIAIRLERGYLAGITQGSWSGEGPAEFERCLELASAGNYRDELLTTLTALIGYYIPRAELRRAHDLLDSLTAQITEDRPWSVPSLASALGSVIWLEGDFTSARTHLRKALADRSAADPRVLNTAWWVPVDPISVAHNYLALTYMVCGDLDSANAVLAESVRRCEELNFPQNAHNRAHTYFMDIWVQMESGQLGRAANLVADLRRQSEGSGLDLWRWVSATEQATVKGLIALAEGADPEILVARAQNVARRVDASRLVQLNSYLTFHDAVIGRLLIAAGEPDKARARLEMALRHAADTGMHFHDAELIRLRAHTLAARDARRTALAAALSCARRQGAPLFELRCLIDCFDLVGDVGRADLAESVARFAGDARWPEYLRAQQILS